MQQCLKFQLTTVPAFTVVCYAECHLSSSVSAISAAFRLLPLSGNMVKRSVRYLTLLQTTYDCSEPAFVFCFVSFHGDAKENLLLLRVINSLMSWCIATELIKHQRLFNCPVIHTDSDRWKRNPRNDLMTSRHVDGCSLIVHENSDRISDRKFSATAHCLELQLYCMSEVTQRAIIGYRGVSLLQLCPHSHPRIYSRTTGKIPRTSTASRASNTPRWTDEEEKDPLATFSPGMP